MVTWLFSHYQVPTYFRTGPPIPTVKPQLSTLNRFSVGGPCSTCELVNVKNRGPGGRPRAPVLALLAEKAATGNWYAWYGLVYLVVHLESAKNPLYRPWYGWYTCTPPWISPHALNHRRGFRANGLASDRHRSIRGTRVLEQRKSILGAPNYWQAWDQDSRQRTAKLGAAKYWRIWEVTSEELIFFANPCYPSFLCTVCANLHKFAQICTARLHAKQAAPPQYTRDTDSFFHPCLTKPISDEFST
jgi:hypothetical protein